MLGQEREHQRFQMGKDAGSAEQSGVNTDLLIPILAYLTRNCILSVRRPWP